MIPTISNAVEIELLESSIINGEATMLEKMSMQKYYFVKKFLASATMKSIGELWDTRLITFFNKLTKLHTTNGQSSLFWEIAKENKWEYVIPAKDFVKRNKQINISPLLLDRIFTEFKFRNMNKLSNKNLIYKYILGDFMGTQVIMSDHNPESKHTMYYIHENIEDQIATIRDLITNHLVNE